MSEFFQYVADFLSGGIQFAFDIITWISIEIKLTVFGFVQSVGDIAMIIAFGFVDGLGLTDKYNLMVNSLPSTAGYMLDAVGIFDAINLLLSASVARFTIKLIPGIS